MEHFANNVEGYFNEVDFSFYSDIVRQSPSPAHFVEVGSWKGRSTSFMTVEIINSGKDIRFDAIDNFLGSEELSEDLDVINNTLYNAFKANMSPVEGYYNVTQSESVTAAATYDNNSIDFVFIDAAHDYDSVVADIAAWLPKVKPGGIIAGHDYNHEPVYRAVNDSLNHVSGYGNCWNAAKENT